MSGRQRAVVSGLPPDVRWLCPTRAMEFNKQGPRPKLGHSPELFPKLTEGHRPSAHQAAKP